MNRVALTLLVVWLAALLSGCESAPKKKPAHDSRFAPPGMVNLAGAVNRDFRAPWPDRPTDGYREWFRGARIRLEDDPEVEFALSPRGGVIVLGPRESISMPLPKPVWFKKIAILCSAERAPMQGMTFTVEVVNVGGGVNSVRLKAKEWQVRGFPVQPYEIRLPAEVNGKRELARLSAVIYPMESMATEIRIKNNMADPQPLLIAGLTLL
ncbi:MAG: hypothetical protein GC154_10640 [bacterium]|nr:hypothetical protein [bacterium]